MPTLQMRTTKSKGKESDSYFLTIPKEIVNKYKWGKGDTIIVSPLDQDSVKLEKG